MKDGKNGAEIADTHNIDNLLWKRPSPEWSSFQFRETLMHWALRWGNGYAEIEPDQAGRPFALHPVHPERVTVWRSSGETVDAYGEPIGDGELYYDVHNGTGGGSIGGIILSKKRVFHVRGFGEGPVGVNVVAYAAESLGWVKAAQLFGASFFGNGANVNAVVMNKKPLKPDGVKRQRAEMEGLYRGPRNANKLAILDNDAELKLLGLDAEKSQLNQTNLALISEVCRWFGVPPHKVMDLSRGTFSNIEHQAIEVVVDSVAPWVKRFEDEADYKLFGPQNRNKYYNKMNMRALLRGDAAARVAYYDGMVKIGAFSPNRVLECEDENTIGPAGDIHVMQNQNVTLEQIAAGVDDPNPPVDPATPPAPPSKDDEPGSDDPTLALQLDRISSLLGETVHA
jgi:HK97 family phage portal protein